MEGVLETWFETCADTFFGEENANYTWDGVVAHENLPDFLPYALWAADKYFDAMIQCAVCLQLSPAVALTLIARRRRLEPFWFWWASFTDHVSFVNLMAAHI